MLIRTLWALAGASIVLAGCYYEPEYYPAPSDAPLIQQQPPAPLYEEIPPTPYEGAVWVAGYWWFGGTNYSWVAGQYMRPPGDGLFWYPGGYVRSGRGWARVGGRWGQRGYAHRYRWVHPPSYTRGHPLYGRYRRYSRTRYGRSYRAFRGPAYGRRYQGGASPRGARGYRHEGYSGGGRGRRAAPPSGGRGGGGRSRRAAPRGR